MGSVGRSPTLDELKERNPTMTRYTEYQVTIRYNDGGLSTYTFHYRRQAIDWGETACNGQGDAIDYKIKKIVFFSDDNRPPAQLRLFS